MKAIRGSEFKKLIEDARSYYRRSSFVLSLKTLKLRYFNRLRLDEIRLMGLLAKEPGWTVCTHLLNSRRTNRWLSDMHPAEACKAINSKARFSEDCRQRKFPVPSEYAIGFPSAELIDNLPEEFFVKPTYGAGGFGVSAFSRQGNSFVSWNGKSYTSSELLQFLEAHTDSRELIFQEWLRTDASLAHLSHKALMTLRIVTFNEADQIGILFVYLKTPGPNSISDNTGYGGEGQGMIELDPVSGKPCRSWFNHPSSFGLIDLPYATRDGKFPLKDITIPNWEKIHRLVMTLAKNYPQLPYLAWDIGLSTRGPVIIEGNTHWGYPVFPTGIIAIAKKMKITLPDL